MRVIESGRLVFPAGAERAHQFAADSLVTIHRRRDRWRSALGGPRLDGEERSVDASPAALATNGAGIDDQAGGMLEEWLGKATEWLLLRDYAESERAKSVLFLFNTSDATPYAVVKVRSRRSTAATLGQEHDVLTAIAERATERTRRAIPRVLGYVSGAKAEVLLLSALPGRPIGISMQRSARPHASHRRHLASAGAWLGTFHRETAEVPFRGRLDDRASVHGDLWPRNILTAGEARVSGVIDWEAGEIAGPFWRDLFTLPLLFAIGPQEDAVSAFSRGFLERSAARRAVEGYFDAYCATSGIPRGALRELFDGFAADATGIAGKEGGWRANIDWPALLLALATSNRSVFSG